MDDGALDQLDALADHLDAGKGIEAFSYAPAATVEIMKKAPSNPLAKLPASIESPVDFNQLEKTYGFLQRAADCGWHLPTSIVRSLTGSTPRGRIWKRFGFEFTPATKHGSEIAWAVNLAAWDYRIK